MLNDEAGRRIAAARDQKLFTQLELAQRAGVSLWTISNIEGGRNKTPRRDNLRRIAEVLELDPAELMEGDAA